MPIILLLAGLAGVLVVANQFRDPRGDIVRNFIQSVKEGARPSVADFRTNIHRAETLGMNSQVVLLRAMLLDMHKVKVS